MNLKTAFALAIFAGFISGCIAQPNSIDGMSPGAGRKESGPCAGYNTSGTAEVLSITNNSTWQADAKSTVRLAFTPSSGDAQPTTFTMLMSQQCINDEGFLYGSTRNVTAWVHVSGNCAASGIILTAPSCLR